MAISRYAFTILVGIILASNTVYAASANNIAIKSIMESTPKSVWHESLSSDLPYAHKTRIQPVAVAAHTINKDTYKQNLASSEEEVQEPVKGHAKENLKENITEKKDKDKGKAKDSKSKSFTDADIAEILQAYILQPITSEDYKIGDMILGAAGTQAVLAHFKEQVAVSENITKATNNRNIQTVANDDKKSSAKKSKLSEANLSKTESFKESVEGPFVTYEMNGNSYTVYAGKSYTQKDTYPGLTYKIRHGEIVQIHIETQGFKTARGLQVNQSRGQVILHYGAPNAILQIASKQELVYFYQLNPKTSIDGVHRDLIAFTIKGYKIKAIDLLKGAIIDYGHWPTLTWHTFVPGIVTDDDYYLEGYRINDTFYLEKDNWRDWNLSGRLWGMHYVASDYGVVLYDEGHLISKVFLGVQTGVTRRGIGPGSSKLLLELTYGKPTKIYNRVPFGYNRDSQAYEYKNPRYEEYLIFIIDKKSNFVDGVLLSDRPVDRICTVNPKEDTQDLINILLYNKITSEKESVVE